MNRRNFLGLSAACSLFPYMGFAQETQKDKACIFVYLHGGISHIDFTHPGVGVPSEFRSVMGYVDTGLNFSLGGSFSGLAKAAKDIRVVRSFAHRDANHSTAAGWVNTGHSMLGASEGGPQKEPAYGSIISKFLGSSNAIGLPSYVKTSKIDFGSRRDGSAWLGANHIGFDIDEEGIRNLKLGVDKQRGDDRMRLVESIDRKDDPLFRAWTDLRKQAYGVAMGKASEAFDLTKEPIETQQKFKLGKSDFGKSLLTALRTIKYGSKFVTVVNGGWDMHNDIEEGFKNKGPELDWGLSLLIEELKREGLFDKVLVVVTSEFGRTPKVNVTAGRDHFPGITPLIFIGGSVSNGVVGKCSDKNDEIKSQIYGPKDLSKTILTFFDMPENFKTIDNAGRPRYFIEDGSYDLLSVV